MSIQKKSLISTLKATRKANVAKEEFPQAGGKAYAGKTSPAQISPGKTSPAQISPGKKSPAQISPGKKSPAQISPAKVQ